MFCVECGAEGLTMDGLCTRCFAKKHRVVEPPPHVDLERCSQCGALAFASGWARIELDLAIPRVLGERVPVKTPFERATFTHIARPEDANNYLLTVKALGRYQELEQVQDFHVRLRLKPSLCNICSKQRSKYYEGIVQVRGEGRELTPREIRAVRTFVQVRVDRGRDASGDFVSRVEEIHGGLDFYVSTNALGKALARELAETFGGAVSSSPKLYGQRDGKEVYRVTSLVRLPAFQVGDVIRHKGRLHEVVKIAAFLTLRDLDSGEERRFRAKDLRAARRIDAERFEASLARSAGGEIFSAHPETGVERPVTVRGGRPRGRAVVIWTAEGAYLSALPADVSKD